MSNELTKAIDDVVNAKVLSGEGFKAIEALRDKAERLEDALSKADKIISDKSGSITKYTDEITNCKKSIDELQVALDVLRMREGAMIENEKATAVANAKAEVAISMFSTVFMPGTVRRNIQGMVPVVEKHADGTQYASQQLSDVTETERDE